MKVREIMKSPVISVQPSETIEEVLRLMEREKINGVPIVDDENHILGIIVKADIYRFLMEPGHYKTCPVDWVMTKEVVYTDADDKIVDAAKKLLENHIIAMPVLENTILVGIVSIEDFVEQCIKTYQ